MIAPRAGSREITMTTASKYGAADAEAQPPAAGPEKAPLGRVKVALICVAAALSGAAVASVARVRTRAYVADLYAGLGGTTYGPDQLNMKQCGGGQVCEGTERCYEKVKDDGTTKYKCAEFESDSLSNSWRIAAARPGSTRMSKKKTHRADSLSGGCDADDACCGPDGKPFGPMCPTVMDGVCDGEEFYSSPCMACAKGAKGPFKHLGMKGRPGDCKK